MKNKTTWKDRYLISISEDCTIKDIMLLRNCGEPTATKIRDDCRDYCIANDIEFNMRKIPTCSVLAVTNKDIEYYYNQMMLESRAY